MPGEAELRLRERLSKLRSAALLRGARVSSEVERLERQLERIEHQPMGDEIWHVVELARDDDRPYTLDYVERLFEDVFRIHGDRVRADDAAIVAGLGSFDGRTVAFIGHQKGRDIKDRVRRNFGSAHPEGYRKAIRMMELADRHSIPLVTFVDTPGAYPGVAAEQHGQGGAIARCHQTMLRIGVPAVACVIGEGGSGGASAIAVADRVLEQEKAAAAFKLDAGHSLELGAVDVVVPEPGGGAQTDHDEAARLLGEAIREALEELSGASGEE